MPDTEMADTEEEQSTGAGATRRTVLLSAGAVGAAGLLAACGSSSTPPAQSGGQQATGQNPPASPSATGAVIHTTDIPVGGGMIYPASKTVVTQPTAGTFKAFDATCKHMGCLVGSISGGLIICPCHGSEYHIADGSVAKGPTTAPLDKKTATVNGDVITVS
jgi:Rieske Fe-S protein